MDEDMNRILVIGGLTNPAMVSYMFDQIEQGKTVMNVDMEFNHSALHKEDIPKRVIELQNNESYCFIPLASGSATLTHNTEKFDSMSVHPNTNYLGTAYHTRNEYADTNDVYDEMFSYTSILLYYRPTLVFFADFNLSQTRIAKTVKYYFDSLKLAKDISNIDNKTFSNESLSMHHQIPGSEDPRNYSLSQMFPLSATIPDDASIGDCYFSTNYYSTFNLGIQSTANVTIDTSEYFVDKNNYYRQFLELSAYHCSDTYMQLHVPGNLITHTIINFVAIHGSKLIISDAEYMKKYKVMAEGEALDSRRLSVFKSKIINPKVVVISSTDVYGPNDKVDENSKLAPYNMNGIVHMSAEFIAKSLNEDKTYIIRAPKILSKEYAQFYEIVQDFMTDDSLPCVYIKNKKDSYISTANFIKALETIFDQEHEVINLSSNIFKNRTEIYLDILNKLESIVSDTNNRTFKVSQLPVDDTDTNIRNQATSIHNVMVDDYEKCIESIVQYNYKEYNNNQSRAASMALYK